jgi:hypothetical protein
LFSPYPEQNASSSASTIIEQGIRDIQSLTEKATSETKMNEIGASLKTEQNTYTKANSSAQSSSSMITSSSSKSESYSSSSTTTNYFSSSTSSSSATSKTASKKMDNCTFQGRSDLFYV